MLIGICLLVAIVSIYLVFKLLKEEKASDKDFLKDGDDKQKNTVKISIIEKVIITWILILVGMIVGWIFYKSKVMMLLFSLGFQLFHKAYHKEKLIKYKAQSLDEFLEINRMLIAEIYSGKSLESAYKEILTNLKKDSTSQYPIMQLNLENWCEQFELGHSIEEVLKKYAVEKEDYVIEQFVDMICVTKEHGGNLVEVIELTNRVLRDKRQIKIDIGVIISEKKLEQKVLSLMPFVMLMLMQFTAYEFIAPLYESLSGRMMMTFALLVFVGCYLWSNQMTRIDS